MSVDQRLRAMRNWLRRTLPWDWVVLLASALYLLGEVVFRAWIGETTDADLIYDQPNPFTMMICVMLVASYGIMRICAFHPLFHADYRHWLNSSPWKHPQPLPAGPVTLQLQDLLIVGLLTLGMWHAHPDWWFACPLLFLISYNFFALIVIGVMKQRGLTYAMLALPAIAIRFHEWPLVAVPAGALFVVLGQLGLRRSLAGLPDWESTWWSRTGCDRAFSGEKIRLGNAAPEHRLGWPFDQLAAGSGGPIVSVGGSAVVAALVAGWSHLHIRLLWRPHLPSRATTDSDPITLTIYLGTALSAARLLRYVWGYLPPISLRGRIRTGRLIIPRFDVVFLAPLAILATGAGVCALTSLYDLSIEIAVPLLNGAMLFVALAMPPTRYEWQLTGDHRIIPTLGAHSAEFQQTP